MKKLSLVLIAAICACSSSSSSSTGTLVVTADVGSVTAGSAGIAIKASALDAKGNAGTGSVDFTATFGALNGGGKTATVALDAQGNASVTFSCPTSDSRCISGDEAVLSGTWDGNTSGLRISIESAGGASDAGDAGTSDAGTSDAGTSDAGTTDAGTDGGTPTAGAPYTIIETGAIPSLLGLKGSGIQETGQMTFQVTDANGVNVPNAAVTFTESQPVLVTLGVTSGTTDKSGNVVVSYASGPDVGVTSITATISTGAAASHSVAVRGAKPSASGFYFHCDRANLPVYTSTPRYETTTCTVRLSDRYGNRVGVATPVSFATESGAIEAVATTQAFDPANPSADEGSATVTFSTDFGNGQGPADVDPLPADAAQYPWPRAAEPNYTLGSIVRNPRDQFVTIIAMARGEEAFVDSNHNGVLDNDEVFYDLGDPFIDSNDDNVYDQVYAGGPFETRFCADESNCASYQGPNGVWDSNTIIWVPTWVVFSGAAVATTTPPGGRAPANDFSPSCVGNKSSIFTELYSYDQFLNTPASGTTYGPVTVAPGSANLTPKLNGFPQPELDDWGAMGALGFDFDYRPVSTSGGECAAPANSTAPTACVMKLLFRHFTIEPRGQLELDNGNSDAAGTCASGEQPFTINTAVVNAHNVTPLTAQTGTYAP